MKKIIEYLTVLFLFAVTLISVIAGCGSEYDSSKSSNRKIKVTIPFDLSEKSIQKSNQIGNPNQFYGPAPSNVRSIRVDAVYPDGRKFSGYVEVAPSTYVEVYMEVDEGSNIYFTAYAYDAAAGAGNLLYTGISSPQTLIMGMSYDITIQMAANTGTVTPTVSFVSPASGATGVPASGIITIIFSKPMDPSTINANTITGATAPIINTSGSTVTISPTPWYSNTTYMITITTGVKDLTGNAMASPYTWSFTTGADGGGGGGGGGGTSLPSAFSFSLPLNNSTGLSTTPTLSWTDSVGETSYTIEIARDAAFTMVTHSATVGTDIINHTVPAGILSASTYYWWRVKAINSYGATTVSNAPFTFTTTSGGGGGGGSAPTTFTLGAPLNSSAGVSLTPTLSWTDSVGETSYSIQIATDAAFTMVAHSATVGTNIINHTVPAGILSASTYYWWRVGATNSYGSISASNAPFTFTTTSGGGSAPTAFNYSLPLNNAAGVSTTPTLSWADSVGETSYTIEIATDAAFTMIAYSTTVGTDIINHTVPAGMLSASTYYWWTVKAFNSYGHTIASNAPYTFTTTSGGGGSAPTTFTLGAPLNSSTGVSLTPTLSWTDSTGETSYIIQIATDAAFTMLAYNTSVGTDIINHSVPAGKLSYSTYYWWRVGATNSYGSISASNAPFTFTTTSGGGSAPTAFNYSLPLNNAAGVSTTPTLSWADSVGETSYTIEIATDAAFTMIAYSTTVGTDIINHTVPAGMLSASTYYWWRVKAINSYGATTVSNAPYTFTTQ